MIPFPPVVFARSTGCLIAQTYVSSNPASALVLVSPPISNAELDGAKAQDGLPVLPTKLAEFDFEPHFPIAVMTTPERLKALKDNRLIREPEVDQLVVDDLEGQSAFHAIQNWLDKLGI